MANELVEVTQSIIDEIKTATENVPFGNSQFQNLVLSTNQETPERQYRHVLLQMDAKINALQEAKFKRDRAAIEMEEIEYLLSQVKDGFKQRLLELDLAEKKWHWQNTVKLINDAIIEVGTFYKKFKELPTITRDEFEAKERQYFAANLIRQAEHAVLAHGSVEPGVLDALRTLGFDVAAVQTELRCLITDKTRKVQEQLVQSKEPVKLEDKKNA